MKYLIFAIRDRAADVFGQPMFNVSRGGMIRAFGDQVNNREANNQLSAHPEDFDLYELGSFDDNSGLFETGTPKQIAIGKDLLK